MNDPDGLPIALAVRERAYVTYSRHLFTSAEDLVHCSRGGIMQKSKAEKLRTLASKRQIVRAKDARELNIPRTYLPLLARRGALEKHGRRLYSSRYFAGTENTSRIVAAYQFPTGVACLLTALRVHTL